MRSAASGYREMPHTADLALEVWGQDLEELFVRAAEGMFSLAATIDPQAPVSAERQIDLSAPDREALLVDWLNELLALSDQYDEAYIGFHIAFPRPDQLTGHVTATQAHSPRRTIKAATFHNLAVKKGPEGYRAVVVFDV